MNPEQWQAVRELFLDASERELGARAKLLEAAGAADPIVAREAALLLAADEAGVGTTQIDDVPAALGLEVDAGGFHGGEAPEHIGRYRVLGVLGDGRSGIVYRVKQENPEREVALKLLRSTMWSKGSLDRFRNEVRALSLLRHEHIARIYDAGTLPEPGGAARPYFVMELVEGKPITEFAASVEMDQRRVIELFLQVCDAVEYAHRQGVIHRDLKPGNVLVDLSRGSEPTVKVIDFGIARVLHSEERATLTGQVLGTPGYMSPEQIEGRTGAVDTRTDVFAVGAILRELLVPRKGAATGRISADLRLILKTATEPDLERRYQSVAAFAGDLRRNLANRPIEARAPTVRYTVSKFVGRNKGLSAAIALALIAVLGLLVLESLARQRAELAQRRAELATEKAEAAQSLMFEGIAEWYAGKIGGAKDRRSLMIRLLPLIEENARAKPDDLKAQAELAKALGAMGDVLEEESLYQESLSFLEKALSVREILAARSPDDPKAVFDLSTAIVRVGDLSERAGAPVPQRVWYLRALAIDEGAVRRWPDLPNLISNLSFSYERLAAAALNRDLFAEATEYSQKQVATAASLMELEPESSLALWGMSSALGMKTAILDKRRMDAERIGVGHEEIEILRELRRRNPGTKQSPKRLVSCLLATAETRAWVDPGLLASSAEMAKEAVSISRELIRADPTEVDAALLHARALCILSDQLTRLHDFAGAEQAMTEAEATVDALAARCSGCEEGVKAQVKVRHYAVRIAIGANDLKLVRVKGRATLPRARHAAERYPSIESKRVLCRVLLELPDASRAESEEAIGLAASIVREDPRDRVSNTLMLAEALACAGRQAEADSLMAELLRSIPATETALLHSLELQWTAWKPKVRN